MFFNSIRQFSTTRLFVGTRVPIRKKELIRSYERLKKICSSYVPKELINPKGVFANNEIDLSQIQIYGFDYDYTLAYYNKSLYKLIFNLARDSLIEKYKYPTELSHIDYMPEFPIRGLHLDKRKGWLMKIDSYNNIQRGTVYRGLCPVSDNEVGMFYTGMRLNIDDLGHSQNSRTLHHFVDLFCLPEVSLFSSVTQFFIDRSIQFNPEYIFADIRDVIDSLHRNQILHERIIDDIEAYLMPNSDYGSICDNSTASSSIYVKEFLQRLVKNRKKVFLITNSPYWFVHRGMSSLCGTEWTNLFDLIICNARKPDFFISKSKPFRQFNASTNSKSWEQVNTFKRNNIYYEGDLT